MICQVKRPDEELYNVLAWDGTRPCCVSNGSANAAAIEKQRGRETGVMWAGITTGQSGQCGSGGAQSVCSRHRVTARSGCTDCSLECDVSSFLVARCRLPRHHGRSSEGVTPYLPSKGSSTAPKGGGLRSDEGQYCCEMVKMSKANLQPRAL